jgi:hypothetical protein
MSYYHKYLKYCKKINKNIHGGRYECKPEEKFNNICIESQNGKYKNKESCINECENEYIKHNLIKSNLQKETYKFHGFIKDIIKNEKFDVYIKGGNVIGLKILRMIYDEYKDDDKKFVESFNDFLKLNLIKDWDFAAYSKKEITQEYRKKLDEIAHKYNLVPRAKTFILYQTKHPIEIEGKALFEISSLDSEGYSKMELPLTTMKVRVTEYNLKYIFMLANIFLLYKEETEFDFDIIKRILSKIEVIIHPNNNGFYTVNEIDTGNINAELLNFIQKYEKFDKNLPQFFITHMKDPFRLLYRLPEKNIPKTKKIINFLEKIYDDMRFIDWLIEPEFVTEIIDNFTKDFGEELVKKYKENNIEGVNKFIDGIYWVRVDIEYSKLITEKGKNLLKNMLKKLSLVIGKKELESLWNSDKNNKFYKLLNMVYE